MEVTKSVRGAKFISALIESLRIVFFGYLLVSIFTWFFLVLVNAIKGFGPDTAYNPLTAFNVYLQGVSGLSYLAPITLLGLALFILGRTPLLESKKSKRTWSFIALSVTAGSALITFLVLPGSEENAVSGKLIFLFTLFTSSIWVAVGILADWVFFKRKQRTN